jgi:hypothetical protein
MLVMYSCVRGIDVGHVIVFYGIYVGLYLCVRGIYVGHAFVC